MSEIISTESGSLDVFNLNKYKKEINPEALYAVNWNGLQKVEDLVLILASIGFVFSPKHAHFETIKNLLDLDNPIIPEPQPSTEFLKEEIKIKLPKVNKL